MNRKRLLEIFTKRIVIYSLSFIILMGVFTSSIFLKYILSGIPPVYELEDHTPVLTSKVFDKNGTLIYEFATEKRSLVLLDNIPVDIQNAVIAMEDRAFFEHGGIHLKGMIRAFINDVFGIFMKKRFQGASTVTMQLSRNIFLTHKRTITRKVREIVLAIQIEANFSKQEILELYLNEIYFGHGAYGVDAASKKYFDKNLEDLTLAECALIVGVVPAPARFSPFNHPEKAMKRRNLVLNVMHDEEYITLEELEEAKAEPLPTREGMEDSKPGLYFIEYIRKILEPKYGIDMLWGGGLKIYTTIDIEQQKIAEDILNKKLHELDKWIAEKHMNLELRNLEEELAMLQEGKIPGEEEVETEVIETETEEILIEEIENDEEDVLSREEIIEAKIEELQKLDPMDIFPEDYENVQGSFIVRDVKTGAIRVLIGGRDYKKSKFNRATQSKRQVGSTFKPFVYLTALQNKYTPATLVKDMPLTFYFDGKNWKTFDENLDPYSLDFASQMFVGKSSFDIWSPSNYGNKFDGWVTLRKGLEKSKNLVSVNLIDSLGIRAVRNNARKAGISADLPYVPALSLGVAAMSLKEILSAQNTLANEGIFVEEYGVERIEDAYGKILEKHTHRERKAFTPQDTYVLLNMMKGVTKSGGTAPIVSRLRRPVAGKTGTTQNHRDAWFMGLTPDYSAGMWVGFDDETYSDFKFIGGVHAAPIWTEIMKESLKNKPVKDFAVPKGISFTFINRDTGKLAMPNEKDKFLEAFKEGTQPTSY